MNQLPALILLFISLPFFTNAQQAKHEIRRMQRIRFKQPVLVLFHLNKPVNNAEYNLVVEKLMLLQLDTLTFRGMINNPSIYFAKVFTSSVPGRPNRKYYLSKPSTPSGLYPFHSLGFPYELLERPRNNKLYTKKEPAKSYSTWLVRKDSSDMGYNDKINTLPGVDSVRIAYVIKTREKRKRRNTPHVK